MCKILGVDSEELRRYERLELDALNKCWDFNVVFWNMQRRRGVGAWLVIRCPLLLIS